ncbi:DEAD/DEAH box helicase [Rhodospirillaceae bacterium SYSU D60014]|uniref:DEAD/DEAH box helicase n=1 Tax=Virgifigura deserti TaxID=2268457 RepID=UPI000E670C03
MTFDDLGLSPELLRAIGDVGYTKPTPIQSQAIPIVLMGRDVLGCAQTGTGKTASFTLPMIEILAAGRAKARMPRSLILEPTRELAAQVAENFELYGKYHKLNMALLIGGESFTDQEKRLDRGVDVLIATPGRLIDLFERGKILMSDVRTLVIDEADRMLDMGFIPDVERIVSLLPKIRQTLFFSATMPPEIRRLADAFLMNPKEITVAPPASPATTVTQGIAIVDEREKREALRRLIGTEQIKNALIFCNRKRDVDILHKSLTRHGFSAAALHGDLSQSMRTETLEKFKRDEITLLVASDVAARGLDIIALSHVFNFDVPIHAEDYVHRIGRTGRAGREGRAFTLATPSDGKFVEAINALIGKEIPRIEIEGMDSLEFEEGDDRRRRGRRSSQKKAATSEKPKRRSEKAAKDDALPAAPAEDAATAAPEKRTRRQPARDKATSDRSPKQEAKQQEAKQQEAKQRETKQRDRRGRRTEDDNDTPVLAFGDHMPNFLRRSVRAYLPERKAADARKTA